MSVFKDVVDVIEVAVRIERKGIEYYRSLYEAVESPEAKSVFSYLAAQEEKHAGVFRKILESVAEYTPRYEYPGEYGLFLNEYASGILREIEKKSAAVTSDTMKDALEKGIEFEKESILFYMEMKSEARFSNENIKVIEEIIEEERSHWRKLMSFKGTMTF